MPPADTEHASHDLGGHTRPEHSTAMPPAHRDQAHERGHSRGRGGRGQRPAARGRRGGEGTGRRSSRAGRPAPAPAVTSGSLAEVGGEIAYHGSSQSRWLVVGLFDEAGQLLFWREFDGAGTYSLEEVRPGRYELHACMASSITADGLPQGIVATGSYGPDKRIEVRVGDRLTHLDFEVRDEVPSGLLRGMDTIFYDVDDLDQAVSFYKEVLGMHLIYREPNWAEFETGGPLLALRRRHRDEPRAASEGGATVVFKVEDIESARRGLLEKGVQFIGRVVEIPQAAWTTFLDPQGNRLQIFERRQPR